MSLSRRVSKLEARVADLPPAPCPGCAHRRVAGDRGRIVLVETLVLADGTERPNPNPGRGAQPWPEPCQVCGETPEFIIQVRMPVGEWSDP